MAAKSGAKMFFGKKLPADSADTLWVKTCVQITLPCSVSEINVVFFSFIAKIQDDRQKWRENDVWEKLQVDSADTLRVKNFVEIALSCSVPKINRFLQNLIF